MSKVAFCRKDLCDRATFKKVYFKWALKMAHCCNLAICLERGDFEIRCFKQNRQTTAPVAFPNEVFCSCCLARSLAMPEGPTYAGLGVGRP